MLPASTLRHVVIAIIAIITVTDAIRIEVTEAVVKLGFTLHPLSAFLPPPLPAARA